MPDLAIVAEFAVACVLVAGGLILIGYPLKAFLLDSPGQRSAVPSLVIGMAVVQFVTWYWLRTGAAGIKTPVAALVVIGAIASVVALVRRGVPWANRDQLAPGIAAVGAAIVFFVVYASVFDLPFHTTSSLGNNDAVSYSVVAQHMVDRGFDDPGQVSNLGSYAQTDGFGTTVILAAASAGTGIGTWKLTNPLMFILVVLGAATLARLLRDLFPDAPVQAGLAAVAGCCAFLFFYIVGQFFLGQILAMAVAPILGTVALRARDCASVRNGIRLAASIGIVVLVFESHYLHMLVPAVGLFGAAALASSAVSRGAFKRAFPKLLAICGAGALAAMVVMPDLTWQSIRRARDFSTVEAGWSLPGLLPSELAGALHGTPTLPVHGTGGYAASAMLLLGFLTALIAVRRTRLAGALFAATAVALILLSYLGVWMLEGVSYRQWKWVTYFQPLFASLVFMVVAVALTDRAVANRVRFAVPAACVSLGALAAVILAVSGMAHTPTRPPYVPPPQTDQAFTYVDPELSNLAVNPVLADMRDINVDVAPYWETMWAVYFLREHQVTLQSAAYWASGPPTAPWTLASSTDQLTSPTFKGVNKRFRLEPTYTGPTSETGAGLEAQITPQTRKVVVTAGAPIVFSAKIVNNGSAAWLASGAEKGAVNLGVQLETTAGQDINQDYVRATVVPGRMRAIPPGATATTAVQGPALAPGKYRLALQMVSEGIDWFGPTAHVDLTVERPR